MCNIESREGWEGLGIKLHISLVAVKCGDGDVDIESRDYWKSEPLQSCTPTEPYPRLPFSKFVCG